MTSTAAFAEIAALAGDPSRAAMLQALMDGRALTASELARMGGVTPQTASGHLARLSQAGLLAPERQGRHRYFRLASPAVAGMMESIMQVVADRPEPSRRLRVGPRDLAMRQARTCYDHLAGRLAVAVTDALVAGDHVELDQDGGVVTESGAAFFARMGLDPLAWSRRGRRSARVICRPCLDWSERRPHLAGALGTALCHHYIAQSWIRRSRETRAVVVTERGRRLFKATFGIEVAALDEERRPTP
ncbi:MAG: winged helix-turn-helix transcriptional regulator [Methylobacteriaceae bacterium]|nr:winged helix-turn-helix transcriptional regulator [Methylobacteriaceae bacterium]